MYWRPKLKNRHNRADVSTWLHHLCVILLEAEDMEWGIALLALVSGLPLLLAFKVALLAVPPGGCSILVVLGGDYPVLHLVMPESVGLRTPLASSCQGRLAVDLQHADDELPEELQERVLLAGDLHA